MKANRIVGAMLSLLVAFVTIELLAWIGTARAASLSYPSNTNLYLSAPQAKLTIQAGSVADALTVSATSVQVELSSSTGRTFTLTSASYDLTVAASGGGGTASLTCSSGIASVVISQSTGQATYTITPTASQCATSSNGGFGGVIIGVPYSSPSRSGGGGSPVLPPSLPASGTVISTASLEAQLVFLQGELASLLAKMGLAAGTSSFTFTRNLSFGMTGGDVTMLQTFLIAQASGSGAAKLKAHGVTNTFGTLTFSALKEFQNKASITPVSGYFGPKTRGYVNSIEKYL